MPRANPSPGSRWPTRRRCTSGRVGGWRSNGPEWAPRTRASAVEALTRLVPLLVPPTAPAAPAALRAHLATWVRPERGSCSTRSRRAGSTAGACSSASSTVKCSRPSINASPCAMTGGPPRIVNGESLPEGVAVVPATSSRAGRAGGRPLATGTAGAGPAQDRPDASLRGHPVPPGSRDDGAGDRRHRQQPAREPDVPGDDRGAPTTPACGPRRSSCSVAEPFTCRPRAGAGST